MPNYLRVAVAPDDVLNDRISLIFRPTSTPVVAIGDALRKRHRFGSVTPSRGIEIHQHCFVAGLESPGIVPVNDTGTGENRAEFIGMKRVRQLFPMHQIWTDSVSPRHISPIDAEGVVLEEEMELAFVVD